MCQPIPIHPVVDSLTLFELRTRVKHMRYTPPAHAQHSTVRCSYIMMHALTFRPSHSLTHPMLLPAHGLKFVRRLFALSLWLDINLSNISSIFEGDPILSHLSESQRTSRDQRLSSSRSRRRSMALKRPYSCDICGKTYLQPQGVTRHYREVHQNTVCMYCGNFSWNRPYQLRKHLKERHPNVDPDSILGGQIGRRRKVTIKLCMYCDVEWNHSSQYKDHLRERHPNVDPDAVLGEIPGSLRRDKIIARYRDMVPVSRSRVMGVHESAVSLPPWPTTMLFPPFDSTLPVEIDAHSGPIRT